MSPNLKTPTATKPKGQTVSKIAVKEAPTATEPVPVQETIVINKEGLKKLLDSSPPLPELKTVTVRCDRKHRIWLILVDGKVIKATTGIISGVTFDSSPDAKTRQYLGCGQYSEAEFSGVAHGKLLSKDAPLSVPEGGTCGLEFDPYEGEFLNTQTQEVLTRCDYLILEADCHATVITESTWKRKKKKG